MTDYPFMHLLGENLQGLGFAVDNEISSALYSIFGENNGFMPVFSEGSFGCIVGFFSWFISVYLCHLMVDFILFIPRLAHKWLKKGYQEGD